MERGGRRQKCDMNSIYTNAKNYKFALWLALCETECVRSKIGVDRHLLRVCTQV
jgi:hypothetical protein